MKKLLSVALALATLLCAGAVAASAIDYQSGIYKSLIAELAPTEEKINERLADMAPAKRTELRNKFNDKHGAEYKRQMDVASSSSILNPKRAVEAHKAAKNLYYDFYAFQLTVFIPTSVWRTVGGFGTPAWQLMRYTASLTLRYGFLGFLWMY